MSGRCEDAEIVNDALLEAIDRLERRIDELERRLDERNDYELEQNERGTVGHDAMLLGWRPGQDPPPRVGL